MAHRSTWGLEGCVSKGVSEEQPAAEGTGHLAVVHAGRPLENHQPHGGLGLL